MWVEMDHRKATICGLTFWVGVGFQNGWIFADKLGDGFLAVLMGNGMTAGAITAVLLTLFLNMAGSRQRPCTKTITSGRFYWMPRKSEQTSRTWS